MNNVNLAGKITRIKKFEKVAYVTISVYNNKKYEFIDVTSFSPDFVEQYLNVKDFIAINGYVHVNGEQQAYKTEIIANTISLGVKHAISVADQEFTPTEDELPDEFLDI